MRYIIVLLAFFATTTFAESYIDKSIKKAATRHEVPEKLLRAICFAESTLKPWAVAYRDGGVTNHAIGLCQVLISTAKSSGWKEDKRCREKINKEDRNYKNCTLFGPYTNSFYAAKYLKYQLDRYNNSWIHAVAAYNAGSVRICKTGWVIKSNGEKLYKCKKGGLLNQRYVDRVMEALANDR